MSKKIFTIVLISLFAILLWVFISLSGEYFYNVKMPINFTDIPQGYAVSNYSTDEITVSLKGQGWQLAQLTFASNPEFNLPVENDPGAHSVSLRNALERNRWLSSSVQINEFSPTQLTYRLEEISQRKIQIVPNVNLNFKDNYGLIANVTTEPDSVVVTGPQSVVENIDHVSTEQKTYSGLDKSITEKIPLLAIDNVELAEDVVRVNFDIQKIVDKEFQNIPVDIVNVPPSKELTVYPQSVNVILRGGINVLGKLDKEKIRVKVSFDQALKDTLGFLVPQVTPPENTEFIDTRPNRLEYIIQQL